jgi:hypothetical protein
VSDLADLYAVQLSDIAIAQSKHRLSHLPEIELHTSTKNDVAAIKKSLDETAARIAAAKKEIADLEVAGHANDAAIARLNKQLKTVIAPREAMAAALQARGIDLTPAHFPIVSENHLVQWEYVKRGAGIGLMTEAVKAALAWAARDWGRTYVRAWRLDENPASDAVLVKAGFLYTGERRQTFVLSRGEALPSRGQIWLA